MSKMACSEVWPDDGVLSTNNNEMGKVTYLLCELCLEFRDGFVLGSKFVPISIVSFLCDFYLVEQSRKFVI